MTISIREPLIVHVSCVGCGTEFSFDQSVRGQSRRKYCTPKCGRRDGKRKQKEKNGITSSREERTTVCIGCGKEFIKHQKHLVSSFCSEQCAYKKVDVEIECCYWCGGSVKDSRSKTYCSPACRINHKKDEMSFTCSSY